MESARRHPVRTVELFFDLVFVFTITRLAAMVDQRLTWTTIGHAALVFATLYWMYSGFAWLTNEAPPDSDVRRVALLAGMACFFVCALVADEAFGTRGVTFGVGFAGIVLVHSALYASVAGRDVARFAPLNVAQAVSLIVAGTTDGAARALLWVVPLAAQWIAPRLVRRTTEQGRVFVLDADHFVERHALLLLIGLGETVLGVGAGVASAGRGWLAPVLSSLAVTFGLWWVYFVLDDHRAQAAMAAASPGRRAAMAVDGFYYAFSLVLLGLVGVAAGIRHAVGGDIGSARSGAVLGGGAALFLAGTGYLRIVLGLRPVATRWVASAAAAATTAIGRHRPTWQLIALLGVLLAVGSLERGIGPRAADAAPNQDAGTLPRPPS